MKQGGRRGGRGVVQQINFISGLSTPLLLEKTQRIIKEDKEKENGGRDKDPGSGKKKKTKQDLFPSVYLM